MTPRILIVAHTREQFDLACRNVAFMRAALHRQRVTRIYSLADVRGRAQCQYLYLLPGCELAVHDLPEIRAYWRAVGNELVELTDLQVIGDEPCKLADDSPMQIELAADLMEIKRVGRKPFEYLHNRDRSGEISEIDYQKKIGLLP